MAWENLRAFRQQANANSAAVQAADPGYQTNQQWGQQLQQNGAPQEVTDYFRGYQPNSMFVTDPSTVGGWYQAAQNTALTGQGDWQTFRDSQGNTWAPNWEENGGYVGFKTAADKGLLAGRENSPDLYFDPTGKFSHGYNNAPGWLNPVTGILGVAGLGVLGASGALGGAAASGAGASVPTTFGVVDTTIPMGTGISNAAGATTFGIVDEAAGALSASGFGGAEFGVGGLGYDLGGGVSMGADGSITGATPASASGMTNAEIMQSIGAAPGTSTMGAGGAASAAGQASSLIPGGEQKKMGSEFSWQDLIGPGTQLFNGAMGAQAADNASAAQLQAAREAMAQTQPWRDKGVKGLNQLAIMLGLEGQGSADFGKLVKDYQFTQDDPSYQFRLNQGLKALKNSYAGKGKYLSGAAMKGINDYAQGAASQEFGNAFNRDLATRTNLYNRLAGISGTGQTAANTMGEYGTQAGNAQAAGEIGKANAYSGGLTGAYNTYTQNQLMNQLLRGY